MSSLYKILILANFNENYKKIKNSATSSKNIYLLHLI